MSRTTQAASFEEFLKAPTRLAKQATGSSSRPQRNEALASDANGFSARAPRRPETSRKKEKIGLTIDPALIDAVDDYIYHERKRGRRLKKNDVYEAALRQFLGLGEGDVR